MKKTYFFDMDGTLIDSMQLAWDKVILKYLHDRNIPYPKDMIINIVTKGFMGIANYYIDQLGVKATPQQLYDYFMVELEPMYQNEFPLKRGVKETLQTLKAEGCSINVISGSPLRFVLPCLKRLGVYDLFDNVLSLEDFGLTKSDRELFIKLAEKMQAPPETCVVVDDSVNAIKTAKSAGLQTVGVYEHAVKNSWDEMQAVANKTITDFTQFI